MCSAIVYKEYYNTIILVVRKLGFYFSDVILLCGGYVEEFHYKKVIEKCDRKRSI